MRRHVNAETTLSDCDCLLELKQPGETGKHVICCHGACVDRTQLLANVARHRRYGWSSHQHPSTATWTAGIHGRFHWKIFTSTYQPYHHHRPPDILFATYPGSHRHPRCRRRNAANQSLGIRDTFWPWKARQTQLHGAWPLLWTVRALNYIILLLIRNFSFFGGERV